jgi:hypothetical protein
MTTKLKIEESYYMLQRRKQTKHTNIEKNNLSNTNLYINIFGKYYLVRKFWARMRRLMFTSFNT